MTHAASKQGAVAPHATSTRFRGPQLIDSWRRYLAGCTAAWLMAGCVTVAVAGPGDLDMRFGDQGRLVVEPASPGPAVVLQQDGNLLVVDGGADLQVRRYLADGKTDISFGQGGRIAVPNRWEITPVTAALQPDGKLLVGGYRADNYLATTLFPSFLVRLDLAQAGAADTTFGSNGAVEVSSDSPYQQLVVLRSGDVVVMSKQAHEGFGAIVDRFDATGSRIDTRRFGDDVRDMAALGAESVVVLGLGDDYWGYSLSVLKRDGFDENFGDAGTMKIYDRGAEHVAVDGQSRIVTCGGSHFSRFSSVGTPDATFGDSGHVWRDAAFGIPFNECGGLVADGDGRILAVVVNSSMIPEMLLRTFVIRLRADGSLDPAIASGSGPVILRGLAPPTQDWQPLWLSYAPNRDARIAWRVRSSAPSRERVVVDAIDLGGNSAVPAVGIASYEPKAMERAGFLELPVVRSGSSAAAASVRYEVLPGSADATDVEVTSGTLEWAAGDGSRRTLRINVTNDTLNEGEERFSVRLRDGNGVAVPAEPTFITLVDDEALRSLHLDKETITWIQSPSAPSSTWPKLELNRPVDAAGPVTAFYYFSNGWDYVCCARGVRWEPGQLSPETIFLTQSFGRGNNFGAFVIDDEWQEVGPSASIIAQLETAPPTNPTSPPRIPTPPAGGSDSSSRGGGGAFGLLDLLLIGLAAGWILRAEFRRATTPVRREPHARLTQTDRSATMMQTATKPAIRLALAIAITATTTDAVVARDMNFDSTQAPSLLVGTWRVTTTPYVCASGQLLPQFARPSMITFGAGGTIVEGSANPDFQPGQRSSGHGFWEREGRLSFRAVFEGFVLFTSVVTPPATPRYVRGSTRLSHGIEMQDADHWTSYATVTFFDVSGTPVPPSGCAQASAERLR